MIKKITSVPNVKKLYYEMLRIRRIEEKIASEYKNQQIRCPTHLCIGHEAIPVGVCTALEDSDIVMSNHRSHGHYLAKGGDLKRMIAELYGKETGCSKGIGGSQHLIDLSVNFYGATPVVGGTIPVATGVAWANKLNKSKNIVVVFFGDAAVEEGSFYESINFAALHSLPIIYVCENNLYSIYTHISYRQPERNVYKIAEAEGLLSLKEDGNDVVEVTKSAERAVKHIKEGRGPVFLEFTTYRFKEHCGPNEEPPGERPIEEFKYWKRKSPVENTEKYLINHKLITGDVLSKMETKIESEIKSAFKFAVNSPFPRNTDVEKQLFLNG